MSEIKTTVNVETKITLELTEGEAEALHAIVGYGPKLFLEWFHKTHGKYYISPHEKHIPTLFDKAGRLGTALARIKAARPELNKIIKTLTQKV